MPPRGLAPMPRPDLRNADMFGPPSGFVPVLPGRDFLYRFTSADVFGAQDNDRPGRRVTLPVDRVA
jgi:hypothetical protein